MEKDLWTSQHARRKPLFSSQIKKEPPNELCIKLSTWPIRTGIRLFKYKPQPTESPKRLTEYRTRYAYHESRSPSRLLDRITHPLQQHDRRDAPNRLCASLQAIDPLEG